MAFWNTVMDSSVPYGKRLVPLVVDEVAKNDPGRICFSYPRSSNLKDGFRDVNFRTFANAVNKTAFFIQREIGRSSMFETVMYMGYPDIRHFIILVALMKTGHKVLFSSHRNSVSGHADLIKRTDCTILVHTAGFPVSGIQEKCRMETICLPELDLLLDDSPCDHYPYTKTYDEAKHHPCLVLHTSGTTSLPKPVVWTHGSLTTSDSHHLVPSIDSRPTLWGPIADATRRLYTALPIFHGAGVATGIMKACFNGTAIVIGPPGLATADTLAEMLEYADLDCIACLPITLEDVATRPDVLEKLGRLKYANYVGGQISSHAGDTISRHVHLYNNMASTETNILVQHATDREDWQYICLSPAYNGITMRPVGVDAYELVFVRDDAHAELQGVFKVFPRLKEYSMCDLYSQHPTKPNHWKYEGRSDDMIVLGSGWNFNPSTHESLLASHKAVRHCILVGNGRDRPAAIIELRSEYYTEELEGKRRLGEMIWPKIQEANRLADTAGQLGKEMMIFATREKPFPLAGKGSIQRKMIAKMYTPEMDELYASLGKGGISV
ncbi:acetyl-CoA synthetase-like protein [Corynespora cassiicola Philippines]|uniref:Acetyl-CoA synthetase-like protein n=1 Tax=Corynespora cassiicola Philippines TaxID=1448308 RepID=A0A2T2N1W7_CORCC|nr:acetyl-CoA synthetase-like protein [Corynespora cassiicola Philippines]